MRITDPFDFDRAWAQIKDALVYINTENAGKADFGAAYRTCYLIVTQKRGEEFYERIKEFEERWLAERVIPAIRELITQNLVAITLYKEPAASITERRITGEKFLNGIKKSWETYNTAMGVTADLLMYLDRSFCQERPSLYKVTTGLYRDHVLGAPLPLEALRTGNISETFLTILNAVIIDQINIERDGDIIDRDLIRQCLSILEVLYKTDAEVEDERLYLTSFEPIFLESSREFYRQECKRLLHDFDARAWLHHCRRRLAEEADRCNTTIPQRTWHKINEVVEEQLVVAHQDNSLAMEGSGLKAIIDRNSAKDLPISYQLISQVDTVEIEENPKNNTGCKR